MEVVEADFKTGVIALVLRVDALDQLFRGNALLVGAQHDRRAVGVVGADIQAIVTPDFLEPYPYVRLYRLQQVAEVGRRVRIGQCAGHKDFALLGCHCNNLP